MFGVAFVAGGLILLVQLPFQTSWIEGTSFFGQPRFWPSVSIVGMVALGSLHVWRLPRRRFVKDDGQEARLWVSVLEFVVWFMAYVWLVPRLGYLPSTLAFSVLLVMRLGYRSNRYLLIAAVFGFIVVAFFKSILGVRIPGAALYEIFPAAVRNFMLVYF